MTAHPSDEKTYFPDNEDAIGDVLHFLQAYDEAEANGEAPGYRVVLPDTSDGIELPDSVRRALRLVVEAMAQGQAVTITAVQ
jgi:hypothetical protein